MDSSNEKMETAKIDSRYECPICLSCLKDTVLTSCGHRFCNSCINAWLDSRGGTCPVDNIKLNKSADLFPDLFTRREILTQKAICRMCSEEINLIEMDEHVLRHSDSVDNEDCCDCPFKDIGCAVKTSKSKMAEHMEMQIHHHLCLLNNSIKARNSRKSSEALTQETMFWEPSGKNKTNEDPQWNSLIKALYERVVILEQRSHEQSAQMQKMKTDLDQSKLKFEEISLKYCQGQYLWYIDHFSEKLTEMQANPFHCFWSQHFYTSPIGYKVCAKVRAVPAGNKLGVFIHLVKSPHDVALEWPFNGRIHLAIIHPIDPKLTITETMVSRPDLESFQRPQIDINVKSIGYEDLISVNDIMTKNYLKDDTLLVRIRIQCV